jgi:DNA invertase Pin-like site-specific DNA recombinase
MLEHTQQIIDGLKKAQRLNREPALVYDRVSTEEQAKTGYSLHGQATAAGEYAERNALHVVYYFTVAESARGKIERKAFIELLRVAVQFDIKHVIFLNADRMTRNYKDFMKIEELVEKHGTSIHFYQDGTIYSRESNYNDRFILNIKIAIAKQRTDEISQHAKQTHLTRAKLGLPPAPHVDGYLYKDKQLKIDPEREQVIRFMFDTYDFEHISVRDLAQKLNSMGYRSSRGNPWHQSRVHAILATRTYTGFFEHRGIIYKGTFPAYITPARFDKRLSTMGLYRANSKKRDFEFNFAGRLRYDNRLLTGELIKGKYIYYANVRLKVRFREEEIAAQVDTQVAALEFSGDFAEKLKDLFRNSITRKTKSQDTDKRRIAREKARLEERQRRLLDLYLDKEIDQVALKAKSNEIRLQIEALERQVQSFRIDQDEHTFTIARLIDNVRNLAALYRQAEPRDRISLIDPLFDYIDMTSRKAVIVWKPEFRWIINEGILSYSDAPVVRNRTVMGTG